MFNNGATFFLFITNNCNLKCLGCMQSCDRIINPYYMSIKELEECLITLSSKDFTINNKKITSIHLTGGDPLTHPEWRNFCKLIHQYLPDINIDISTNGLLLNKISDQELIDLYQKYSVHFQLSLYADKNLLLMYKKIIQRFKKLNTHLTIGGNSHFFFSKQERTVPKKNNNGYTIDCYNVLSKQNYVIFYKGKIYSCWKDINILQKENNHLIDDAYTLNMHTPKELVQNKSHYYCNICKSNNGAGGQEFILWQHHSQYAEEVFNSNLKELFVYNYQLYYQLQHECKKHIEILSDELFQQFLPKEQKHYTNIRFLKGKGDIFIPFSNDFSIKKLLLFLNNIKDIDKYNIYFISIKTESKIEEKIYSNFLPFYPGSKLNNYFLKANNLFDAYKTFLNNSYLHNKFIIDIEQNNFELLPLN